MAILLEKKDEEKDKEAQSQNAMGSSIGGTQQPVVSGSPIGGSTITAAPTSPIQRKTQGSGQFQNVKKFLGANTEGAQRIASATSADIEKRAADVKAGVQGAQQQFAGQAAGTKALETGGEEFLGSSLEKANQGLQLSQDELNRFTALRTGQMDKINTFEQDLGKIGEQERQAIELGQGAQTEAGRFALLRSALGNAQYTGGQQRLDQLLLGSDPTARQTLATRAGSAITGLGDVAASEIAAQAAEKQRLQNRISALQGVAGQQIGETLSGFETELKGSVAQREAQRQAEFTTGQTEIQAALKAGDFAKAKELTTKYMGSQAATQVDDLAKQYASAEDLYKGFTDPREKIIADRRYKQLIQQLRDKYAEGVPGAFQYAGSAGAGALASEQERQRYEALKSIAGQDTISQYRQLDPLGQARIDAGLLGKTSSGDFSTAFAPAAGKATSVVDEIKRTTLDTQNQALHDRAVLDVMAGEIPLYTMDPVYGRMERSFSEIESDIRKKYPGLSNEWVAGAGNVAKNMRGSGNDAFDKEAAALKQSSIQAQQKSFASDLSALQKTLPEYGIVGGASYKKAVDELLRTKYPALGLKDVNAALEANDPKGSRLKYLPYNPPSYVSGYN